MENISHAESAAGSPGWKASGLLLLVVGIFFFPLRALKFAASRAWKSVWGEMCAEICAEMQQGAQSPDPHLAVLMQGCCAGMLCPVLCCPFLQAPVVTAPPWDGFFVPGGWREAVELLLCLEVALEKDNIRVEEASWPMLLPCVGCPSAETKLWAPVAPFLALHGGASTQNSGAFHFPKSRFPSSCFFFPTFTAEGIGEDFLYPEARSDETQLLTNKERGRKCSFCCNSSLGFPALWRRRCLGRQKVHIAAPNGCGGRCVRVAALMGWGRWAPGTLVLELQRGRTVTVESLPWKYNSVDQSTAVFASQLPTEHGAPGLEKGSQCSLPSWAAPGWEPSTKRGPAGQQGNTSDEQAAFC